MTRDLVTFRGHGNQTDAEGWVTVAECRIKVAYERCPVNRPDQLATLALGNCAVSAAADSRRPAFLTAAGPDSPRVCACRRVYVYAWHGYAARRAGLR